jgi:signal peptidase I
MVSAGTESLAGETKLRSRSASILDQLTTIGAAVLIALLIRAFVIEPFRIPSESMLPTLLVGDHLFVNKFLYGARIPFTDLRLPALREPRRGDVVVFEVARQGGAIHPADRHPGLPRDRFVKRIVGMPGDTVEVTGRTVRIDGAPLERAVPDPAFVAPAGHPLRHGVEVLDGRPHPVLEDPSASPRDHAPFRVEPGRYFMMGDNRDHSNDSRNWGTVRFEELKGPAFVLYWSWDWNGSWGELLRPATWCSLFGEKMRWGRIGDAIR